MRLLLLVVVVVVVATVACCCGMRSLCFGFAIRCQFKVFAFLLWPGIKFRNAKVWTQLPQVASKSRREGAGEGRRAALSWGIIDLLLAFHFNNFFALYACSWVQAANVTVQQSAATITCGKQASGSEKLLLLLLLQSTMAQ